MLREVVLRVFDSEGLDELRQGERQLEFGETVFVDVQAHVGNLVQHCPVVHQFEEQAQERDARTCHVSLHT